MNSHVAEAERRQQERYPTVWEFKSAWLRSRHPEWSAEEVAAATRRIFLTGYAGD